MRTLDTITEVLVLIGGLNWLLIGLFHFDVLAAISGQYFGHMNALTALFYIIVGLSAIYQAFAYWRMPRGYVH